MADTCSSCTPTCFSALYIMANMKMENNGAKMTIFDAFLTDQLDDVELKRHRSSSMHMFVLDLYFKKSQRCGSLRCCPHA
jgi:hypothetical protein